MIVFKYNLRQNNNKVPDKVKKNNERSIRTAKFI